MTQTSSFTDNLGLDLRVELVGLAEVVEDLDEGRTRLPGPVVWASWTYSRTLSCFLTRTVRRYIVFPCYRI